MSESTHFSLQRIYLKDASFESPHSPDSLNKPWSPKIDVDMKHQALRLKDDFYQIILTITVEASNDDQVAFIAECQQAGSFEIRGFDEATESRLLAAFCPSILFPYARQSVSHLITEGGFPSLLLQPVNFDALYDQHQKAQQQAAAELNEQPAKH